MVYKEYTIHSVFSSADELRRYVSTLEEERDNYEMLLKYLGAFDDNVDIHKFEDVVDRIDKKLNR